MNRLARLVSGVTAACLLAFAFCATSFAADPSTPAVPLVKAEETNAQELLRGYLQLQEQMHQAQLSIEQSRREAREAAVAAAESLSSNLKAIEAAVGTQRARELEAMQSSNRVMLLMAGAFAALGFLAMVLMAYFQWRTVHGLAEISAVLPGVRTLGAGRAAPALGPGELPLVSAAAEESGVRLLGAMEQLEERIRTLERGNPPSLKAGQSGPATLGNGNGDSVASTTAGSSVRGTDPATDRTRDLLAHGQALLDQDEATAALAFFDQALSTDAGCAEALVKKGAALERLGDLSQAVDCYNQAIATDNSLTVAYLHKGGLFNRMEKYSEALECYEKALRTQEKRAE